MKGTIVVCLKQLVEEKFGKSAWEKTLKAMNIDPASIFLPASDVDDAQVLPLLQAVCKSTGLTLEKALDAFGEYWVTVYSQKTYAHLYSSCKSAKDFLLKMDDVHVMITKKIPNAHPPRFTYEWKSDKCLHMGYSSKRNMIDLLTGLVKGVGKHYRQSLSVKKLSPTKIEVHFA